MTDDDDIKAAQLRNARIKEWSVIIGIVASIVLGGFSYFKEEKEDTAKKAYIEVTKQLETASRERVQLQKDLASIRGYLAAKSERPVKLRIDPEDTESAVTQLADAARPRVTYRNAPSPAPTIEVAASPAEPEEIPELEAAAEEYSAPPVEELVAE